MHFSEFIWLIMSCVSMQIENMESVHTFVHTWKLLHYIPLTSICQDMNRKSSKNSLSYDKKKFFS